MTHRREWRQGFMALLITYALVALIFSFFCSIAEAVILSVSNAHIAVLEQENKPSGAILRHLKEDINKPLAAILSLNTIAHTVGAAGAGAQAAVVFGSAYLGVASALLTLLILVFSEIIPKTLGASYWRELAPTTAHVLRSLIVFLYPFVLLSEAVTRRMTAKSKRKGLSRIEFSAMAEVSLAEGELGEAEYKILKNLLRLRDTCVSDVMTPRTVVYSLPADLTIGEYMKPEHQRHFSRIPVFHDEPEKISGFVLRNDLLLAQAQGHSDQLLAHHRRDLIAFLDTATLIHALNKLLPSRSHMGLVVGEYGDLKGVVTLEDVVETLLGLEIVDEGDENVDMRALARNLWEKRARDMGIDLSSDKDSST